MLMHEIVFQDSPNVLGNGGLVHQYAIDRNSGTLSQATSNEQDPEEADASASSPLITREHV